MNRRQLLVAAGVSSAGILLKTSKSHAATRKRVTLVTTWSPKMPILQESVEKFAELVETASNKQLRIKVYAGGELIPPMGVFDAVSSGDVEAGVGASYYWSGKIPASPFFCAVPFGLDTEMMSAWLSTGGGQELWEETYAPHNLQPIPFGNTGPQLAGWFKKELHTIDDLKGLKMRIPGLGGKVMARAGVNVVLMPGAEIFTALERGVIDATEWVSPFFDERLGLHRAAQFCYYPGWQEPSANLELTINRPTWESWSRELQTIVKSCAAKVAAWSAEHANTKNAEALSRLKKMENIQILPLPKTILSSLREHSDVVLEELSASDPQAKKALESYRSFRGKIHDWRTIALQSSSFLD